ncbi:MAG: hypothetical protein QW244_02520 [Candidatus Pacearchaeota archaeon]
MITNNLMKKIELLLFSSFMAFNIYGNDSSKEYELCLELAEKTYKSCLEANKEKLYRCLIDNCTNATYAELCSEACFEENENNDLACKDNYDIAKIECEDILKK